MRTKLPILIGVASMFVACSQQEMVDSVMMDGDSHRAVIESILVAEPNK